MSINGFTPSYNNGFHPYNFDDSSDDETYNTSISIESEDFTEISMESDSATMESDSSGMESDSASEGNSIDTENSDEYSWGSSKDHIDNETLMSMHLNAEIDFMALQEKYSDLFKHPGIKEKDVTVQYPEMDDIKMDIIVVKSITEKTHFMTSGVGPCLVVMARGGLNDKAGLHMAFSHSSMDFADQLLPAMRTSLEAKGCSRESIEFFIVGGKMPYRYGPGVYISGGRHKSKTREEEFLELSKEFNIVGAQLYLADGVGASLSVILSKDEIVWELRQHKTDGNCLILS